MSNKQNNDKGTPLRDAASAAGSVASDLRNAATQKFDETVSEVRSQANESKDSVAGEVKDVATALRKASEGLRHGSAQERTLSMIADGLADASSALHDKDLGEMVQAARKVARNNPALFLGGAVLLGFAASRYAKASAEHSDTAESQGASKKNEKINRFVNEGNPNTQPFEATT